MQNLGYTILILASMLAMKAHSQQNVSKSSSLDKAQISLGIDAPISYATENNYKKQKVESLSKFALKIDAELPFNQTRREFGDIKNTNILKRGGVGDGGGSGIACFKKYEKNVSQKALDSQGRIREEYRAQIRFLLITDFFEILLGDKIPEGFDHIYVENDETPENYLARIINQKIRPLDPKFAENLERALYAVRRELWNPVYVGLPAISDRGSTQGLDNLEEKNRDFCAYVQIIRRQEIQDDENGSHTKILSIEYDPRLYSLLKNSSEEFFGLNQGVFQQAFLILHEALYSMAVQIGQEDSVNTRALARSLLAEKTYRLVQSRQDFITMLKGRGFAN